MVALRGKGAMTNVNLLMVQYDNARNVNQNGKETRFPNIQVDSRDPRAAGQTQLHVHSKRDEKSKSGYNNDVPLSREQFDAISQAAGPNTEPLLNQEGDQVGTVYGFKASLMPASDKAGLVPNTKKELGQSDFKVDGNTLDSQYAFMSENSKAKAAEKAAQKDEPEVETPEADQQAVEPEPQLD